MKLREIEARGNWETEKRKVREEREERRKKRKSERWYKNKIK